MSDPYAQPGSQQPQPPTNAPGPAYPAAPQAYPGAQAYPPGQPYPQAYPPGQPYAQPYPAAQPYPVAQPYAPAGYPGAAAPAPRSSAMGVISLLGSVVATAASVLAVGMMAAVIEHAAISAQSSGYTNEELLQQQFAMPTLILTVAGLVGFTCWILSIVATATNRGRVAGIIGIILGVLAPIGVGTYFFVALYQTIQHLQ